MDTFEPNARRWHIPRWWELLPEALLLVGLGYFFFDETDPALSAFKSTRALALMVITAIAWIAARLLFCRFIPWPAARVAPLVVAAVAILAIVVLPAYRTHTVVERLRATPIDMPASDTQPAMTEAPSTAPAQPEVVRSASFHGIDHRARGTVTIYRRPDGRHVIGLEDFDIQPGPDYDVYVVPGTNRTNRTSATRIDDLRGNAGTQYYDAPVGLNLEAGPWTVLIWCQTFSVPVANATPI
jgi:hypothetical protein